MSRRNPNELCRRCRSKFGRRPYCQECGVHKDRKVVKRPGRRGTTRKRGRNSGKVRSK